MGINGQPPPGSTVEIVGRRKIQMGGAFDGVETRVLMLKLTLADGSSRQRPFMLQRRGAGDFPTLGELGLKFRAALGFDDLHSVRGRPNFPRQLVAIHMTSSKAELPLPGPAEPVELGSPSMRKAFWEYLGLETIAVRLNESAPPSADEWLQFSAGLLEGLSMAYRVGRWVRQDELAVPLESKVRAKRRSEAGSKVGGRSRGKAVADAADQWREGMLPLAKQLVAEQIAAGAKGVSRAQLRDLVVKRWPAEGFGGVGPKREGAQISCPEPSTIFEALRVLETSGKLVRPASPRGRRKNAAD